MKQQILKFLKWSEKYTKTDMVYLIKGGGWLSSSQLIISGIGFLVTLALANLLSKEVFGSYQYVLSVAGLMTALTLPGINTALIRAIARGDDGSFHKMFLARLNWGLLGSAICVFIALYYFFQGNQQFFTAFLIVAFIVPTKESFLVFKSYWHGNKKFATIAKILVFNQFITGLALVGIILLSDNLNVILFTYFGTQLVTNGFFFLITSKQIKSNSSQDKNIYTYGKHLSFLNAFGTVTGYIDGIILWFFLGPISLAVYTFAKKFPAIIRQIIMRFLFTALPKLPNREIESLKKTLLPKMMKMFVVLGPITIIYMILAPHIFELLLPQYIEAIVFSQVFALTILFAPFAMFGLVFKAHAKTKELYISNVFSTSMNIVTLLILVPLYGIIGAVIARLITKCSGALLQFYLFRRI